MALTLHVRLPNGVELGFCEDGVEEIATHIQVLGDLACFGSPKVERSICTAVWLIPATE
ncbi:MULTISPECIES: hypothetical protein [unclassified Paraburkholderia]|uniref:hypothetical protein n=1 Tax=unclassified Paraburkholderia TaxID=2615204 RepID=UPI002AB14A9D|nr:MULTISPECIES: hypothetical protein [unclassified Paraburkholderia]